MPTMLVIALTLALGAAPEADAAPPSLAVWVEPLGEFGLTAYSYPNHQLDVYVPVGVNFFLGQTELSAELAVFYACTLDDGNGRESRLLNVMGSLGPVVRLGAGSRFGHFFLQPELKFEIGRTLEAPFSPTGTQPRRQGDVFASIEVGLDAGYEWRIGHFYVALVLGGGLGYGVMPGTVNGVVTGNLMSVQPQSRFVVSINANLLRLGASF